MITYLKNKFFTLIYLLIIQQTAGGQQLNFVSHTVNEGLPNSNVLSVLQDNRGFLWVGTTTGVVIFDGETWHLRQKSLTIKATPILDIFEDNKGAIWFAGGNNGLYKYDGEITENYIGDNLNVISVCDDANGSIWVATENNGVFQISNENSKILDEQIKPLSDLLNFPEMTVFDMSKDRDGNIWLGTSKGLCRYDGTSLDVYTLFDGLPHNKVTKIFEDNLNRIWFCTPRGVVRYDYEKFQVFNKQSGLISNEISSISQDLSGKMWFGGDNGIELLDGDKFDYISTKNGLVDKHINTLKLDESGNMWIGTKFGGISMFSGYAFTKYSTKEGLISNQIFSITTDEEGVLYFGSLYGIISIKSNEIKKLNFQNLELNKRVNTIIVDRENRKWFGSNDGLFLLKNNQLKRIDTKELFNVSTICEGKNKQLWIASNRGLFELKEKANGEFEIEKSFIFDNKLKHESKIRYIYKDKKEVVWFGFQKEGLYRLDGSELAKINIADGDLNITSITTDFQGNIWCGTEHNGIFIVNKKNEEWQAIKELNPESGLWVNKINSILFLNENTCLIGTNRGVSKITFDKDFDIINRKKIGSLEGMSSIETTENSLVQIPGGKVIIGSLGGIVIYDPVQEEINLSPPNTHITAIKLFFEDIEWSNSEYSSGKTNWFNIPKNLSLPPNQNHITFEFTGINLKSQVQVRYQWKLSPLEINWSPPRTKNEITYSELPPGNYTFSVKSYNEDGTPDIEPAIFEFRIQKPFYKTLWFILLAILFVFVLGVLFFRWRTKQLIRAKEKLEKQVADRTSLLIKEKERVVAQNKKIRQQAEELETQTDKLFQYNTLLENQNRDITDSINYARTIQKAVLGSRNLIRKVIPESFILYIPKDIVSGDFYWYSQSDSYIYIAAADCTGHGVPGAFMSIIAYNLLKETIAENKNKTSGEILDRLNITLIELLSTHKTKGFSKNGMDIALCRVDLNKKELNFAGAMRPMYWLKKDNKAGIETIKPNRFGIGDEDLTNRKQGFNNHFIGFDKGDRCYLFTDGFIDQFGGKHDKKYLGKRFKELLYSLKNVPIKENESELYESFVSWKGTTGDQTDDILVIGLEF